MAAHTHRRLAVLMALVLWPALVCTAAAQQPSRQTPVFLWGIQRLGVHDKAVETAVKQRLQQLGEVVLPMPAQAAAATCSGPACGLALRDNTELTAAQVLGGNIETADNGDWRGRLWWVDVASAKVVSRAWRCRGCSLINLLPREAALLVASAPAAPADVADPPSDCSPKPPEPSVVFTPVPPSAEPMRTALENGVRISLLASQGARVALAALGIELQKSLQQMGLRASLASTAPSATLAASPTTEAALDVELASSSHNRRGTVEEISLTLRAQGRERQLRFYCPAKGCQTQLAHSLRINLGVLLDSGDPPVVASAIVPESSRCPSPPIAGVRVASAQDPVLPSAQPDSTGATASASDSTVNDGNTAPPSDPGKPNCQKKMTTKTTLRVAGIALLVAGAVGMIPSGIAVAFDKKETGTTSWYLGEMTPNVLNTRPAYIAGFTLSGIGLALGGGLLLGSAFVKEPTLPGGAPCAAQ